MLDNGCLHANAASALHHISGREQIKLRILSQRTDDLFFRNFNQMSDLLSSDYTYHSLGNKQIVIVIKIDSKNNRIISKNKTDKCK